VPSLELEPLTGRTAHSVKMNVSNVFAEFQVEYLQAFGEGKLWEITQIAGTLQGKFQAVMSPTFQDKYALEFSQCSVQPEVKVTHMKRKTWHTADFFGLGLIVTRRVKQVLEEQTEKIFIQKVCGLYEFTEQVQQLIEHALALQHATLPPRANLPNPYLWQNSQILQWMRKFNQHAHINRFSIKSSLEPFLDGLGTSEGWCAFGATSDGCYAETPEAISSALKHAWNVSGGHRVSAALENLSVRLIDFTLPRVVLPTLDDSDGQLVGFDVAVGPLRFKLLGSAVLKSDAYSAQCDIRKNFSIDVHFSIVGGSGCFLVQADANKYNALSAAQKSTLACADRVLTNFRLERFIPSVGLDKIDVHVSPGQDEKASTRLVLGLQELVDELIVTGINNAEDTINALLATLAQNFVEQHMGVKGGLRGLFEFVGHDIGSCPDNAASSQSTLWAWAAGITLSAALAVGIVSELRSRSSGSSMRFWGSDNSATTSVDSLANAPSTAARYRLSVPMFILGCVLLYIQSNTGIAAVMTAYLTSEDFPDVEVYELTEFGVIKSILDLWNNDMPQLATLLFCFSVIFPYCKLTLCMISWLLPLPPGFRGKLLCVLNTLGKWSFIDAYVLMTLMGLGSLDTKMHGGIGVAIFIDPRPSFVSFLVATVISLILGEVIGHCHELNLGEEHKIPNASGQAPRLLIHLLGFAFVLFFVSSCLEICSFEVQGITGWFLNFLQKDASGNKFSFSMLNLGTKLWNVTSDAHRIEAVFMQILYFLTAFAMNASFLLSALSFASIVMPRRAAGHIQEILPMVHSWSAADVFAVGVILTVQETKRGSFVYTPPWLKTKVRERLRPRIQMPGASNDIIQIVPRLEVGAWLLVLAVIICALVGYHFLRLIRYKDLESSQQLLTDEEDDASEDNEEEDYS